jgi:hypothetical protein
LIGMRPFKRPEFEDIHASQRTGARTLNIARRSTGAGPR